VSDTVKRSPFRAPFKNKPKLPVFWQSGEIKRSRIAILMADLKTDGFLVDPGNSGRQNANMRPQRALYGAQFWRIFVNGVIYGRGFSSRRIGRFYGRIFVDIPWVLHM
jgi:hypothetical protein